MQGFSETTHICFIPKWLWRQCCASQIALLPIWIPEVFLPGYRAVKFQLFCFKPIGRTNQVVFFPLLNLFFFQRLLAFQTLTAGSSADGNLSGKEFRRYSICYARLIRNKLIIVCPSQTAPHDWGKKSYIFASLLKVFCPIKNKRNQYSLSWSCFLADPVLTPGVNPITQRC